MFLTHLCTMENTLINKTQQEEAKALLEKLAKSETKIAETEKKLEALEYRATG